MWNKTKVRFRIVVLCLIALFVLLPLLSSPVAATVVFNNIGACTHNTSGGPTVSALSGGSYKSPGTTWWLTDDGSGTLIVYCDCSCIDSNSGGTGSDHYIELNVYRFSTGQLYVTYLSITLNPNTQIYPNPTTISVSAPYTTGGAMEQYSVYVYAYCEDLQTTNAAWNTWYWTVWV